MRNIEQVQNFVKDKLSQKIREKCEASQAAKECLEFAKNAAAPEETGFVEACLRGDYLIRAVGSTDAYFITDFHINEECFSILADTQPKPGFGRGISLYPYKGTECEIIDAKTGKIVFSQKQLFCDAEGRITAITQLLGKRYTVDIFSKNYDSKVDSEEYSISTCKKFEELVENLPQFLEESKTFVSEDKYEEWCECVLHAFENYCYYNINDIDDVYSAAKIMKTIETESIEEARKLMTANGNSDLWDMDTKLLLRYNRNGAECFKGSERYKDKLAKEKDEGFRQEIINVVDSYIANGDYNGRMTRN